MDGVLADFYQGCHDWVGVKVNGFPYQTGWDWPKELEANYKDWPIRFWESLPKHKDADKWLAGSRGKVYIATCPCSTNSICGKALWVKKHYPELETIFIRDKWLLADIDRILIDDNSKQCIKFEQYGGTGILVPRPWNEGERYGM